MEAIALNATIRDNSGKEAARAVRKNAAIPAVIYGGKGTPVNVSIDKHEFILAKNKGNFKARPVQLNTGKETINVLPKDLQTHPVTDEVIHIDFLRLEKGRKVKVMVRTAFTGEERSPGVKRGGILNIVRRRVECWCDPDNIPDEILADVSDLAIGEAKKISAVELPEGVSPVIDDRDFTIAAIVGRAKKEEATEETATAEGAGAAEEGGEEATSEE